MLLLTIEDTYESSALHAHMMEMYEMMSKQSEFPANSSSTKLSSYGACNRI